MARRWPRSPSTGPGQGRGGLLAPGRAGRRGRAGALRPRRADRLGRLAALPRAHRRRRARPAGLRPLGQARRLRLLDRRLRPVPEEFLDAAGIDRFSLVVHDWGAVGLATAQRLRERVERLVVINSRAAHARLHVAPDRADVAAAVLGELAMGFTTRFGLRQLSSEAFARPGRCRRSSWTPSGALRPRHPAGDPQALPRLPPGGARAARAAIWAHRAARRWCCGRRARPLHPRELRAGLRPGARRDARRCEVVEGAGHWLWLDRPEVVARVAAFLAAPASYLGGGARQGPPRRPPWPRWRSGRVRR